MFKHMAARIWLVYKIIGGADVSSARIPEIKKTDFAKSLRFSRKTIPGGATLGLVRA